MGKLPLELRPFLDRTSEDVTFFLECVPVWGPKESFECEFHEDG